MDWFNKQLSAEVKSEDLPPKNKAKIISALTVTAVISSAVIAADIKAPIDGSEHQEHIHPIIEVNYANTKLNIDGMPNEADWQQAKWHPIDQMIIGPEISADDFSGQYKLLWRENKLFLLTEIIDDVMFDQTADPTVLYWDDDTVEVFLDEDASGGEHQYSHNAFAYHVALDRQVADFSSLKEATTFNDHIDTKWSRDPVNPQIINWEMAINIFPENYNDSLSGFDPKQVSPVTLTAGKIMGFMLAYCDNDRSHTRENFIGSHPIKPIDGDMNRGYKDANVFGKIKLIK
ncbi:sugar-binding protein [Shewanella sp. TC10]|uniref:sugar-binding protein n=1 Tax=Shewanella sp. TC10 TaxID=1419739 RepID=UPI00129E630A|nr:sugar-binding protein [Shewanella sp. TC10]